MPMGCQQTEFRIASRPISQPKEKSSATGVSLHPYETHRLICESPSLDHFECIRQEWVDAPEKEHAIGSANPFYRQRANLFCCHASIRWPPVPTVICRGPLVMCPSTPIPEQPGWVCIDNIVLALNV